MDGYSHKPSHGGYPGESDVSDLLAGVSVPMSMQVCFRILGLAEQQVIEAVARYAHGGYDTMAERTRVYANYEGLSFRPDADQASGVV